MPLVESRAGAPVPPQAGAPASQTETPQEGGQRLPGAANRQELLTLSETIARLLGWLAVFWPRRPQGKHRHGAQAQAGEPTPVLVHDQPTTWPPCVPSARLRHRKRYGAPPPPAVPPPSVWVDTGPLVRAYVLHHEKRQHAQAPRLGAGGNSREGVPE